MHKTGASQNCKCLIKHQAIEITLISDRGEEILRTARCKKAGCSLRNGTWILFCHHK